MSQPQSMCLNSVAKTAEYVFMQMSHFVASLPLGRIVRGKAAAKRFGCPFALNEEQQLIMIARVEAGISAIAREFNTIRKPYSE